MNRAQRLKGADRAIFLFCWGAYFSAYMCRNALGASMPAILAATCWDKAEIGLVSTGFYVCYGFGQLVNGYLGDRLYPVRMIACGLLLSGLCNLLMAFAPSPGWMLAVWCANGYALSLLWTPIVRTFATRLTGEARTLAGVNISLSIPAGTFACYGLSALMLRLFGWHAPFAAAGCIGLAASAVFYLNMRKLVPNAPPAPKTPPGAGAAAPAPAADFKTLARLFMLSGLIFITLGIAANGMIKDSVAVWASTFFAEFHGMRASSASLLSALLPITSLAGVYLGAGVNRRLQNEVLSGTLLFGLGGVALLALRIFGARSALLSVCCLCVCSAAMYGANTLLQCLLPLHFSCIGRSATIAGLQNALAYGASALSSFLIGLLSERFGWSASVLLWLVIAVSGTALCLAGGGGWKRYLKMEREGTLPFPSGK